MNLLLYITALLLALSGLSYQSLYRYRQESMLRNTWDQTLQESSLCAFNEAVREAYNEENEGSGKEKGETNHSSDASSKMNFEFFLQPKSETSALYEGVAKNLLMLLYGKQEFFQKLLNEDPDILSQLFQELRESNHDEVKKTEDLSGLTLKSDNVKELFYNICKKAPIEIPFIKTKKEPCLQASFIDYLSNKKASKIRLFLAPIPLLFAIYGEASIVKEILDRRQELFREVSNKADPKTLEAQFKAQFSGRSPYEAILDYSITKTDPRDYATGLK